MMIPVYPLFGMSSNSQYVIPPEEQADINAAIQASLHTINTTTITSSSSSSSRDDAIDLCSPDSKPRARVEKPRRGKRDKSRNLDSDNEETEKNNKKKKSEVVILDDTDDENEKDKKLTQAAAKKKAKATKTILGEPLFGEDASARAKECLSQSILANETSKGLTLRPGFVENPAISPSLPSNHMCFTDSPESEKLARTLLKDGDIQAYNFQLLCDTFKSCAALYLCLMTLLLQGRLIVNYFLRGCGSSGVNPQRCRKVLTTIPDFKMLIELLESVFGQFGRLWVAANRSGKQKKHGDKLKKGCTHRALQSYLCIDKIMWYECQETGVTFGLLVPHGAFLILSTRGGGFDGKIYHSVDGGEHSWLLAFDFSYKNIKQD